MIKHYKEQVLKNQYGSNNNVINSSFITDMFNLLTEKTAEFRNVQTDENNYEGNYISVPVNDLKIGDVIPYLGGEATITDIRSVGVREYDGSEFGTIHEDHRMNTYILDNDEKKFVSFTNPEDSTAYKLNAVKLKF